MARSAGSRQKSRSRAACTREPRVAATDGGSGRRSMAENRKDSAQLVNDDTFEGERLLGRGNGMAPGYADPVTVPRDRLIRPRSEEHTSELQSLMRISYAVFCLKKKKQNKK